MTNTSPVAPVKAPDKWGVLSAAFFATVKGQAIMVHLQNGEVLQGRLVGVDKYDVCLEPGDHSTLLVTKHAIAWIEPGLPTTN